MVAALLVVVALAAGVVVLLDAAPAAAHAVLVSSDPQDGSNLETSPEEAVLVFDESVQLPADATSALADDGTDVAAGDATLSDGSTTVSVPLQSDLATGSYTVSYRIVSADGHVVEGAIRFGIRTDPAIVVVADTPTDPLTIVSAAAQGLVYTGAILLIGTVFALTVIWPGASAPRRSRLLRGLGWGLLGAGTLVRLAVTGPLAEGSGWGGILRLDGLGTTLSEIGGIAQLIRLALLALVAGWTFGRLPASRATRLVAAAAGLALLVTVALDGHAVAGDDAVLAVIAAVLHLAGMCVWVGGLVVLAVVLLPTAGNTVEPLVAGHGRWSKIAFAAVVTLIVSGEYQAWRQLSPLDSLVTTAYGWTLLIKCALVAVALAAASLTQRALRRRQRAGQTSRIRRIVVIETAVTIAIVAATTVLVALPPARTTYGPAVTLSAAAGTATATVQVESTRTGPQQITVTLRTADGDPVAADAVSGRLSSTGVSSGDIAFAPSSEAGVWEGTGIAPVAGTWTLQLTVTLVAGTYVSEVSYPVW